jgi:hypothetical protein
MPWFRGVLLAIACLMMQSTGHAAAIFSVAAATSAGIQASVDAFRTDLGSLNANVAGSFGSGRREINWDGVPDAFSAPNNLPANFFNVNSPRGVVFATSGTGFQVSANSASGTAIEFGNINATYPDLFTTFSSPRLFTALGSTITDVQFFIPGTTTGALTRGFGAVFTDVDLANTTSLEFFDADNNSLGTFFVPSLTGNQTLEFLGVDFGSAIVSRVRITSGNSVLGPNEDATHDLVVMDDFIYGEPVPVPEPTSLALLTTGLAAVALARRRRKIT